MNFGLALASQRIPGITFDLAALNNHHEPESAEAALVTYSKLMLPERDLNETVQRLAPLLNDPNLVKKVNEAAGKSPVTNQDPTNNYMTMDDAIANRKRIRQDQNPKNVVANNQM